MSNNEQDNIKEKTEILNCESCSFELYDWISHVQWAQFYWCNKKQEHWQGCYVHCKNCGGMFWWWTCSESKISQYGSNEGPNFYHSLLE
jgi:hypothetical protein